MSKASNDARIRAALTAGDLTVDPDGCTVRYRGNLPLVRPDGYLFLRIDGAFNVLAHRVVWLSAHPHTPDTMQINHRNGRRWDNRLSNLEAVTPSGNMHHAHGHSYAAVASSSDDMDGNSVDPAWFEQVMTLAAQGHVTAQQIRELKPEREDRPWEPYTKGRVFRGR